CDLFSFFFQAEDGIRDGHVTGVQTCALPISRSTRSPARPITSCRASPWSQERLVARLISPSRFGPIGTPTAPRRHAVYRSGRSSLLTEDRRGTVPSSWRGPFATRGFH